MNLKKIKIIAVIGIFILSFLVHFAYDLFPNTIFSFFFPVNESIWEHMKILFTAPLIYGIIDYIIINKNKIKINNFAFSLYFTSFINIPIYLVVYLPIYKLLGENIFISITIMLLVYSLSEYLSYRILQDKKYKVLNKLTIPIITIVYLGFIYLTYNPPHTYIFYDTQNKIYGINK